MVERGAYQGLIDEADQAKAARRDMEIEMDESISLNVRRHSEDKRCKTTSQIERHMERETPVLRQGDYVRHPKGAAISYVNSDYHDARDGEVIAILTLIGEVIAIIHQ